MDSGYFEYAQGHANAFGISIDDENLRDFHNYANEALANYNFGENAHDVNFIRSADSDDLSNLILDVASLTPTWGQGNKEALIYVRPETITTSNIFVMGSNKEHLRITINGIEYVKFYATELIEKIQSAGRPVQIEMVCKAAINEWGGQRKPQMLVEDCEITIVNNEF
jgi:single-stranded-DNA-specific exonuclease